MSKNLVPIVALRTARENTSIVRASAAPVAPSSSRLPLPFLLALCALTAVGPALPAHAQSSYTVTDLGRLPNSDTSYPHTVHANEPGNVKVAGNTALRLHTHDTLCTEAASQWQSK